MRLSHLFGFGLLFALILSAGCIGEKTITEGEAEEGWRVVSEPLQEGQRRIQNDLESRSEQELLQLLTSDDPITETVECNEGGSIEFVLRVTALAADASLRNPYVDFDATFEKCQDLESTVEGELDIAPPESMTTRGDAGTSGGMMSEMDADATVKPPDATGYEGELNFTGDVDGICPVDMYVVVSATGQPEYHGDWCGYEASEVTGFLF